MKQSDIVTVVIVGIVGLVVSYFTLNAILSDPDEATVTFKTIAEVSDDLSEPSPNIFNSQAINPTIEVFVGGCVDINQDGSLDDAESALCGNNTIEVEGEETTTTTNSGTSTTEITEDEEETTEVE